jgi:hypothetical protein
MLLEVLDFLMGYESYLRKRRISVSSSKRYKSENIVFTGLSLRFRADISKVTAYEGIQYL